MIIALFALAGFDANLRQNERNARLQITRISITKAYGNSKEYLLLTLGRRYAKFLHLLGDHFPNLLKRHLF
jgi:hypothetical protein